MATVGEAISTARKAKGMKMAALGAAVDKSEAAISSYENGTRSADAETIVRIATELDDESILHIYLENNPVYKAILPKVFPELNNIRRDPAVIFNRLAKEAKEAAVAADELAQVFENADPEKTPNFEAFFKLKMEQIVDVKRAVEILEFQLIATKIMSKECHRDIYDRQQEKCELKGHHKPERSAQAA